jgi:amidase
MIGFSEYRAYDGIGLAQLVRQGDVSSAELADVALAAIERLNPQLNAVIRMIDGRARTFAGADHLAPEYAATRAQLPHGGDEQFWLIAHWFYRDGAQWDAVRSANARWAHQVR